ncbi:MAG: prolipoprotein diacylglyceryl transferase [Nanoarchaeota archaeon]
MINWNVNPELFNIFGLSVRYYGLFYALGFVITFFYLDYLRKKIKLELSKDDIYDLIFYLVIGVVLGARIFEVLFWNPSYYFKNLGQILAIWNGGMSFHGGLIGAVIAALLYSKKHKISFLKLADILIIPATLALFLGRLGNLFNSEIYGTITNVSWCFNFDNVIGCRHPYQIYSSLAHLFSFFILLKLSKKQHKEGYLFSLGLLLFGLVRFVLDFYREDLLYYGLTLGQYFSIPLILISLYILTKK